MSEAGKVTALNHLETQYDEMITLFNAHGHASDHYSEAESDAKYFRAANDGHGSGFVAEKLDGLTAAQIIAASVPSGIIGDWAGEESTIPAGFVLCNGLNGTPDLRGRFTVGAGGTYAKGATGGADSVTPTVASFTSPDHTLTEAELPGHYHGYTDTYNPNTRSGGNVYGGSYFSLTDAADTTTSTNGQTGSPSPHNHPSCSVTLNAIDKRPPYMALCSIMKL